MYQQQQQQQQYQMMARPSRANELLEGLKNEIEALNNEISIYKHHKEEYDKKLNAQLQEIGMIQQTLQELERGHARNKMQYEEEILRLKKQLDQTNGGGGRDLNSPAFRSNSPAAVGPPRSTPTPTDKGQRRQGRGRPTSPEFYQQQQPPLGSMPFPPLERQPPPPQQQQLQQQLQPLQKKDHDEQHAGNGRHSNEVEYDENGRNGPDWIVGYNPNVQTNLNIDLLQTMNHNSVVCCVKFSPDGKYLATGCNRNAQIYDTDTGRKLFNFYDDGEKEGDLYIRSVCFSPDGKYLATGAEDKKVKIWDIASKKPHQTFVGHDLDIYSLDYTSDGRFLVSGSGDKKTKIWDIKEGKCAYTLGNEEVGPKNGVTSVAVSPDGRLIAAGSLDNIVRLWDTHTGYFLERYEGHTDSVYSVAFSPDGRTLVSGSLDKSLRLWELSAQRSRSRCRNVINGHKDFVLSVAFSPCGDWLVSGSKDRSVQFWDPRTGVTHMMLQGHKNSVISVALSPKGGQFATGSGDFRSRLWKYDS